MSTWSLHVYWLRLSPNTTTASDAQLLRLCQKIRDGILKFCLLKTKQRVCYDINVSYPETFSNAKLLASRESRHVCLNVDKPTQFLDVQNSLLDLTFTKDSLKIQMGKSDQLAIRVA